MAGRTVKKDQNTKKWYFILTHGKKKKTANQDNLKERI